MPSSEAKITKFTFSVGSPAQTITGVITDPVPPSEGVPGSNGTITAQVPYGTDVTAIAPVITLSAGATSSPLSNVAQDFSSDVTYTVTAEDTTTTATYVATITALDPPTPVEVVGYDGYKPRVPGWAGTRVFEGTVGTYATGGVELPLGEDFEPRFPISVMIDGAYTGFFDVETKKLKVYGSSGQVSDNTDLSAVKYVVILMKM